MANRKRHPLARRMIRVFVAAPRDLVVERRAVRETIEQLNIDLGDEAGVQFVLFGEEGTGPQGVPPSPRSPHEEIDSCDVFVLVLYRHWGQEYEGSCTSDTEAEFHLALDRLRTTELPEILVLFKNLDVASMADPGPQLTRVMQFRRSLEGWQQVVYRTFDRAEQLQVQLARYLQAYVGGELPQTEEARAPIVLPVACVQAVKGEQAETRRLAKQCAAHQQTEAPAARQAEHELALALQAAKAAAQGRGEEARQTLAQATEETVSLSVLSLAFEFHFRTGDLATAEQMLERWLAISGRDNATRETATALANLAQIYERRNELDRAEETLLKALAIDERLGHQESMADDYDGLGLIYERRGQLDRAEEMLRKTLAIDEQLGQEAGMATDYSRLALICQTRGDLDRAEEMLRKSLAFDQRLGRQEGVASDYGSLGLIYQCRGQIREARQLGMKARDIYAEIGMDAMVEKLQAWLKSLPNAG